MVTTSNGKANYFVDWVTPSNIKPIKVVVINIPVSANSRFLYNDRKSNFTLEIL